jgi:hypothetical protein
MTDAWPNVMKKIEKIGVFDDDGVAEGSTSADVKGKKRAPNHVCSM